MSKTPGKESGPERRKLPIKAFYALCHELALQVTQSQVVLKATIVSKEPGEYEVRYVTGLEHQVLARDRITITE